jgi:uroporphyrinogen-III decarboxylase
VEHFREFAFEPAAQVASAMKKAGALIIYHTAETSRPYLQEQVQLPVDAVNVGEGVRLADLKKELGTRRALMGNFDPMLLRDASPESVAAETEKMVRENLPGGGYMFNTGEGVMQNSRPENVAAMMVTARRIGDMAGELI